MAAAEPPNPPKQVSIPFDSWVAAKGMALVQGLRLNALVAAAISEKLERLPLEKRQAVLALGGTQAA